MLDHMFTLIAVFLSVVLFILYQWRKCGRKQLPGPKGYPILGNVFDVRLKKLHLDLFRWSKDFGDLFQFNICGKRIIALNSSEVIRELFTKEPHATITSARPATFLAKYLSKFSDVFFPSYGKLLIRRRKFLHQLLHMYVDGLKSCARQIENSLTDLINDIRQLNGKPCDPVELIDEFILGTLEMLLTGEISDRKKEFQSYVKEMNHSINEILTLDFDTLYGLFPFLRFTSLPGAKAYRRCVEKRDGLLQLLESLTQNQTEHHGVYHQMKKTLKEENTSEWFSEDVMLDMIALNVIFGGYITTRNTLVALVRILLSAPDVQRKLQDEVDTIIGQDRKPTLSDRYDMPYTEAVVLECLRFISHVPLGGLHATSEDTEFRGYHIPKGTTLISNQWAANHNDKDWDRPFEFDPDRFLTEDVNIIPADHPTRKKSLTFGVGKRSCIGEVFAKTRIFLFITTLMQSYTITPEDDKVPPMLDVYDMLPLGIQRPPDFNCKFEKKKHSI